MRVAHLQDGAGVSARVHNDPPALQGPDPQSQLHLAALAAVRHPVLNVAVPRETERGVTWAERDRPTFR